jgi:hypothetical protein
MATLYQLLASMTGMKLLKQPVLKMLSSEKKWPENDSTMCMRMPVAKLFVISQLISRSLMLPGFMIQEVVRILQTYIGWSHSKLQSLYEWYFVQAAAIDSRARTTKFSTELNGFTYQGSHCP